MPAYSRQGSAWEQTVMRQRSDGDWSDNDALGFVRVGSNWVPFQSPIGDALGQPINLVAIPGDLNATITWTNNLASGVNADNVRVQYRLPETTPVWTEQNYPITAANFGFLNASTTYQFQVRYITRDPSDGQIDATGPISERFFTTTALTGPGTPAADPGGSGADSIITWPFTGGTPGAVGSSNCWWEYVVQVFDPATYVTTDSSVTDEIAGDIGELEINFLDEGFDCGATLRLKYREVCDSVPQDWQYGTYFTVVCDYEDPCGGINQTVAFDSGAWTDAIVAMPKICYENFETKIEDYAAADVEYGRLPGFLLPLYRQSIWELVSRSDNSDIGSPVVAGFVPGLVPIGSSVPSFQSDATIHVQVFVDEAPSVGPFPSTRILTIGGTVQLRLYAEGAGVKASVLLPKSGGGTFSLNSNTELPLGQWHAITVTIDQDDDKVLWVNGQPDVTDTNDSYTDFSKLTGAVELYGNPNMRHRKVGVWDRVLNAGEVLALSQESYSASAGADAIPGPNVAVEVDDLVLLMVAKRTIGFSAPTDFGVQVVSGAVLSSSVAVTSNVNYDTLGVSDGSARLFAFRVTTAGVIRANGSSFTHTVIGLIVIRGTDMSSGLASALGTTAQTGADHSGNPNAMSLSLGAASASGSLLVVAYGGGGNAFAPPARPNVFTSTTAGMQLVEDANLTGRAPGDNYNAGVAFWVGSYRTAFAATNQEDLASGGWSLHGVEVVMA